MNRQQFEAALEGNYTRLVHHGAENRTSELHEHGNRAGEHAEVRMRRGKLLEKSAERNPAKSGGWFNLGLLEKAEGNSDAGMADFQKARYAGPERRRLGIFSGAAGIAVGKIRCGHRDVPGERWS